MQLGSWQEHCHGYGWGGGPGIGMGPGDGVAPPQDRIDKIDTVFDLCQAMAELQTVAVADPRFTPDQKASFFTSFIRKATTYYCPQVPPPSPPQRSSLPPPQRRRPLLQPMAWTPP